ncbi:hypothetical protein [Pontibacter sp. 13R65]|uniref:hypothetical protein n=1 Tax=Pontibacter sp. 13R65 TaxID=3127458 RepID=UPI00301CDDEE
MQCVAWAFTYTFLSGLPSSGILFVGIAFVAGLVLRPGNAYKNFGLRQATEIAFKPLGMKGEKGSGRANSFK